MRVVGGGSFNCAVEQRVNGSRTGMEFHHHSTARLNTALVNGHSLVHCFSQLNSGGAAGIYVQSLLDRVGERWLNAVELGSGSQC